MAAEFPASVRLQPKRFALPGLVLAATVLLGANFSHRAVAALGGLGFGQAPYASYTHETIAPALVAGLLLACVATLVFFGEALAKANGFRGDWLAACAQTVAAISRRRFLAATIPLQIAAIIGLETLEQTIAFGHPLSLAAVLGGPVFIALTIHVIVGGTVSLTILVAAQSIVVVALALTRGVGPAFRRLSAPRCLNVRSFARDHDSRALASFPAPLARRTANRPPPLATSPA